MLSIIILFSCFIKKEHGTIGRLVFNDLEKLRVQDCLWQLPDKNH